MTGSNIQLIQWLVASLFWISVLISICGVALIISPGLLLRYSAKLNRWISTSDFFEYLDKPRYIERMIYRYHSLFGIMILLGAGYCLYIFIFDINLQKLMKTLPVLGNVQFSAWFYEILFYIFVCADGLALIIGTIILFRPSLLKGLETFSNQWIASDKYTSPLDRTHSIPEHILPGNIRLFGLFVLLGGIYIMFNTGTLWIKGM